ncbi:MAG: imidazole glycerol phosphate synthase subunit HisH [Acidimicrobiales bacterium]
MTGAADGTIAVLDYGIGNLRSAEKALVHLGAPARLVVRPTEVDGAAGVVLPGVGAFGACAAALERTGLGEAARRAALSGVPFLGICVGFQLLYARSEESPGSAGLGILEGEIRRLPEGVKLPQMQWNRLERCPGTASQLLEGQPASPWVYFVHSYAPVIGPETVATCDYGGPVAAVVEHGNVWGTQFHPEKSGTAGLSLLSNFVTRCAATAPAG